MFPIEPGQAIVALELFAQARIEVAQVGDIGERVGKLRLREGTPAPVGKARGFVQAPLQHLLHQRVVGDGIAIAARHGRDLAVENRRRHAPRKLEEDFEVLARGVKHFEHALIEHQRKQRREIDAFRLRVDHRFRARSGRLHQAQLIPIGGLAHEFGVDGDKRLRGEFAAQFL